MSALLALTIALIAAAGVYLTLSRDLFRCIVGLAVLGISILFILLLMYFLAFDLGTTRASRIYVRDMIYCTQAVAGFGWFVYRLAHH